MSVQSPDTARELPDVGRYRIRAVAEMTHVSAATLRAWERRYKIPRPCRTASAYRLYSDHDVAQVRRMQALCEAGHSAAQAAEMVLQTEGTTPAGPLPNPVARVRADLLEATRCYDAEAILAGLRQALSMGHASGIYEQILSPLMVDVGHLWSRGQLSIGQEHLLSSLMEGTLAQVLQLVQAADARKLAVLACWAGETHCFGLYGAGLRFAGWGYRVVSLGANVPPEAVGEAVAAMKPAVIGLSCVHHRGKIDTQLCSAYGEACGDIPWIVGGAGSVAMSRAIESAGGTVAGGNLEELRARLL